MSAFETNNIDSPENSRPFNPWRDALPIPAIGPKGELVVRFADPKHPGAAAGQNPVTVDEANRGSIHPAFARLGWVLYEDLCRGRIDGIESSPLHWEVWTKFVAKQAKGFVFAPGSIPEEEFYHPEVLRRRAKANDGGLLSLSSDDVAELFGFGVDGASDLFDDET